MDEVGLCLFETDACLAYDETDLPPELADLDLGYHLHLPLDLDWPQQERAWQAITELVAKTAFLAPKAYVLHPHKSLPLPEIQSKFESMGIDPAHVLLENIKGHPLADIWPELLATDLSVCLDLGHVLAYGQHALMGAEGLWERVRMVHLSAPDPAHPSRHRGLPLLDREGRKLLQEVLAHLSHEATVMIEVFDEPGLAASLNFFETLATQR